MIAVPYRRTVSVAPGVRVTFFDAGHVLGSAVSAIDVEEPFAHGKKKRIVFTGDLGRKKMPILKDPEIVEGADVLLTESTYGDRLHKPIAAMEEDLAAVLYRTYQRGGKVVIPSFALERAQELLYAINELKRMGRMPNMPVYVDSPLTVKITDIFRLHPECYDSETRARIREGSSPFDFEEVRYVTDKEESKAIDASSEPAVIIAASGMCEAGRIVHHLRATIEDPKNTVCIVGFQAAHTLGRRIVERRPRVKIFGVERDLRAEVVIMNGFSAHADQRDLVEYATELKARGSLDKIVLVHGEETAQKVLIAKMQENGLEDALAAQAGMRLEV
jgi:metallo-beta-lactamase family protein